MFTKIYEKIKEYIKKEYKFLTILLTIFLLFTIKLPYYIDMPGGIINISDRITIDDKNNLIGTLNFAYVSEARATIPTYLIAKINDGWDILKKEQVVMLVLSLYINNLSNSLLILLISFPTFDKK